MSYVTPESKPFDPISLSHETKEIVCSGDSRKYTEFYCVSVYGGISTGYTVGCNLRCIFCWVNWLRDFPTRAGSFHSPQKTYKNLITNAHKRGITKLRISGGEPTLCPDHIFSILDQLQESNFLFILETNGILFGDNKELIQRLKRYSNIHVRVSIKAGSSQGFEKRTGARGKYYALPFKAIEYLKKSGISFHVAAMTDARLMKKEEREQMIKRLRSIGYQDFLEEEICDPYTTTLKRLEMAGVRLRKKGKYRI